MDFFHGALAPRPKNDRKSWHPLWKPVPVLIFCVLFFGFRAGVEKDAASRQRKSFGTIGQCNSSWRGGNYCHYTFPVGDEQYANVNRAAPELELGQTVVVHYDSQYPGTNALEDFSEQSRKDRRFVYILLLVLVAVVAAIFWDRTPYRKTAGERTS